MESGAAYGTFPQLLRREMHALMVQFFRLRFWIVVLPVLFFIAFLLWEPILWKLVTIGSTALLLLAFSFIEYWRVRRVVTGASTIQLNFWFMLLIQSVIIFVTGGIESPLIIIYIPLCLGAGLLLGEFKRVSLVILLPVGMTLLFALDRLHGWIPSVTPRFFDLGAGWAHKPVYVWTTALVIVLIMTVSSSVSVRIRRMLEAKIQEIFNARESTLHSLSRRNREILSVSSTIAHELKNPLASIKGLSQLLARGAEPGSKSEERLQVMQTEIDRMSTVLYEFRTFARPLSALLLENIDLSALVRDVVLLHEGLAERGGLDLRLRDTPVEISCDPQKLKQALINLVINALEATPPGGRVDIRLGPLEDGSVRIEISDTGTGLSAEARQHLFETGFTTKPDGSGVGLKLARSIVRQHGGDLALENLRPRGCRAVVTLPIRADRPDREPR